jgi:hypothetical protein
MLNVAVGLSDDVVVSLINAPSYLFPGELIQRIAGDHAMAAFCHLCVKAGWTVGTSEDS